MFHIHLSMLIASTDYLDMMFEVCTLPSIASISGIVIVCNNDDNLRRTKCKQLQIGDFIELWSSTMGADVICGKFIFNNDQRSDGASLSLLHWPLHHFYVRSPPIHFLLQQQLFMAFEEAVSVLMHACKQPWYLFFVVVVVAGAIVM